MAVSNSVPHEVRENTEPETVRYPRSGRDDILRRYDVEWLVLDTGPYHAVLLPLVQAASDRWRPRPEFGQGDVVVFGKRVR